MAETLFQPYDDRAVLNAVRSMPPAGISEERSGKLMRKALALQNQHNIQDRAWLKTLQIEPSVRGILELRMIQRGGAWLEFVQAMVGFKGSLGELEEVADTPTLI